MYGVNPYTTRTGAQAPMGGQMADQMMGKAMPTQMMGQMMPAQMMPGQMMGKLMPEAMGKLTPTQLMGQMLPNPEVVMAGLYGGVAPEESYVENILRMNRGKIATVYTTNENNPEWAAKIFRGRVENAARDHVVLSDPETGMRYMILMVNIDFITFDEPLRYQPGIYRM